MIIPCSGSRGCGSRQEGGLYACTSTSVFGRPVEEFVIDPAREFRGEAFRAPILYQDQDGVNHMLIWIGAEFYPFVPDFVEEVRKMGVSRRIPRGFPIEKLTPYKSKMILIHSKAIPDFGYFAPPTGKCLKPDIEHLCTFDLWPLSSLESVENHKLIFGEEDSVAVATPSVTYRVSRCTKASEGTPYVSGAFAAFHFTHLEFVSLVNKAPKELAEKVTKAGISMIVLPD